MAMWMGLYCIFEGIMGKVDDWRFFVTPLTSPNGWHDDTKLGWNVLHKISTKLWTLGLEITCFHK